MIEFDCPHCHQRLFHQDEFAGRDGWCRFCKGIIVIPRLGEPATLPELTPEQRFARLERMFKHAASIVDEHRQLQARLQNGGTGLVEELRLRTEAQREVEAMKARVEDAQRAQQAAVAECEKLNARIAELDEYGAELRQQLEKGEGDRKQLETEIDASRIEAARIPEIEAGHAETRTALDEQLKENDSLLERLLDVEQELETVKELADKAATAWQSERSSYEQRMERLRDELCAAEDESVELTEKIERNEKAFADTRTELEAANTALTEEKDALQHQLSAARTVLQDLETRRDEAVKESKEAERLQELAEKRAAESRGAWEAQREQLHAEIESFRTALRSAEEQTAEIRAQGRDAVADLRGQLDTLEAERANESRLRVAADESAQRMQRRAVEAESALDDAVSRRDVLSRQLESVRTDLETERQSATQLNDELSEAKASIEALTSRLTEAQRDRDDATERLAQVASELQSAQRINTQLKSRLVDLEELLDEATTPNAAPAEDESLREEVEGLIRKITELQEALEASHRERTRLEERLVSTENRAAYSELEGVEYRSQFSSMAKQFFEQEVARLTDAADDDPPESVDGDHATVLDAVTQLRH